MPSGKSAAEAPDADDGASAEAAEAAATEAEARAEAARTRANELRRKLETATAGESDPAGDGDDDLDPADPQAEVGAATTVRRRGRPGRFAVAAGLVILMIAALSGATGWMLWEHRKASEQRHRAAEYAAAARQGAMNLMSMDYTQAKESVQRIIDDSVGRFKDNFVDTSQDLIKALQDSKMITKVTVNDAAVESMDDESAVVLVAATSRREGPNAPKEDQQPRVWRVVVTVQRDGGQIKMSDIAFI